MDIWERKNYAVKPLLVKGDGPIMKMRAWYSQFYTEHKQETKTNPERILTEV